MKEGDELLWLTIAAAIILISLYFFYSTKKVKQEVGQGEKKKELSHPDFKQIQALAKKIQPNLEGKLIVNGHFAEEKEQKVTTLTHFSYILIGDKQAQTIQVLSYHPETKEVGEIGKFTLQQVELSTPTEVQAMYSFTDRSNNVTYVETLAVENAGDYAAQISFDQSVMFSAFREWVEEAHKETKA